MFCGRSGSVKSIDTLYNAHIHWNTLITPFCLKYPQNPFYLKEKASQPLKASNIESTWTNNTIDQNRNASTEVRDSERQIILQLDARRPRAAWQECQKSLLQRNRVALPSSTTCDRLVIDLCNSKYIKEAFQSYSEFKRRGESKQTWQPTYRLYQALISSAGRIGDMRRALEAFQDLKSDGFRPNKLTYCGIISNLAKHRKRGLRYTELAYELWQELRQNGETLDVAGYNIGMNACMDVGKKKEAVLLLEEMTKKGLQPDIVSYNIHLKYASRSGKATSMNRIFQKMIALGLTPTSTTYNTLIDGFVQMKDINSAKQCANKAIDAGVGLDVWGYSTLIKGLIAAGDLNAAGQAIVDMRAAGIEPSDMTLFTLVDGYTKRGDIKAAEEMIKRMLAVGNNNKNNKVGNYNNNYNNNRAAAAPVSAYNALLRAKIRSGEINSLDLDGAVFLLQQMVSLGMKPRTDTYNTLMGCAIDSDDPFLAIQLHTHLCQQGLRPDGVTYTILIQAHGRSRQLEKAVATFETLSKDNLTKLDLTAYAALVDAFARAGDMAGAEKMLQSTIDFAERIGQTPPIGAFGAVATGYARVKQAGMVMEVIKRYHATGGTPDFQMLDMLADVSVRTAEFKMAMQAVRALELLGADIDKNKYREIMELKIREAEEKERNAPPPVPNRQMTRMAREKRRDQRRKNVYMERFKFWLGLPNTYYDEEDDDFGEEEG